MNRGYEDEANMRKAAEKRRVNYINNSLERGRK